MKNLDKELTRRNFISSIGKGIGLATLSSPIVGSLFNELKAATKNISNLPATNIASDEDFWGMIQQSFSVTRSIVNLNNGGVSPSPKIVTEALIRYQWQQEELPPYMLWQILEPQSETIRIGLADLFGCDKEEMAIVRNTSDALEIALFGLDLKKGDEVLTTTQDYPRMLTTLKQRELREGIVLKQIKIPIPLKNFKEVVDIFEEAITPRTKIILISHQINITGQILPVKEICELANKKGIEVIVDGAHSFAQFDFKLKDLNCDYFGTSLHKWLHAPKGTGFLYVKKEKIEKLWPLMAAEKSQSNNIRKYEETGTRSAAPRLAIGEAILFYNTIGAKRKEARLRFLARYWMNNLKNQPNVKFSTSFDDKMSCAIGTFEVEGVDVSELGSYLMDKHKIFTTPIKHAEFSGIRITPNVYTTLNELDRFCEIVTSVAKKGIPKI